MQYHCENILNIFWPGRKIKSYRVFLKQILNQIKDIKVKKWKVSYIVIDKCNIGRYFDVYTDINWDFNSSPWTQNLELIKLLRHLYEYELEYGYWLF